MKKFRMIHPYQKLDSDKHKEFEVRNTRVSEYLRKYGTGRIDHMPTDSRPEVKDNRSTDEMLGSDDSLTTSLSTEELDVLVELDRKKADFEAAIKDIELTNKQKKQYDDAMRILNDSNATFAQKSDAFEVLEELKKAEKVTRAR